MSTAAVFNQLGQTIMPTVTAAVFPDTLTVRADTKTSDSGGGYYDSGNTTPYTNIPCKYVPFSGQTVDANGKLVSVSGYRVTMPTHYSNAGTPTRINLDAEAHTLVVAARGNEPVKVFRIVSVGDKQGVVFEVICELEA